MKKAESKRIIVDTNLWRSMLINRQYLPIFNQIANKKLILLYSSQLLLEIESVCTRPKFKKYFDKQAIAELISLIVTTGERIVIKSNVTISNDPKDNFPLELAKDGQADYLITGDKELMKLTPFEHTKIIAITSFIKEIANG